jgi:hypothetical protein
VQIGSGWQGGTGMEILINHIGYHPGSIKRAIAKDRNRSGDAARSLDFVVVESKSGHPVFRGEAHFIGSVASWKDWIFWSLDFSDLIASGFFAIVIPAAPQTEIRSESFEIAEGLLLDQTIPAVLRYFRSQHCTGIWDQADRNAGFVGRRSDRVDVHGGWYDASGDISKYLSHLSYANYMNPQQTPMVVWNFLEARKLLDQKAADSSARRAAILHSLRGELLAEAVYGADFLVRLQDPAGYFYVGVFDKWSKDPQQRELCSFRTQAGDKSDDYQAGYRQGGGMAIAALARISTLAAAGDFGPEEYLQAAVTGFHHLEEHNVEYLDDGIENIIDDYCGLLAAAELYNAAHIHGIGDEPLFLETARKRASGLTARLSSDERFQGWWCADEEGARPYFHAAEAGLPVIALLRYREVEPEASRATQALSAVHTSLSFELTVTEEVANPFGYARQYVRPVGGRKHPSFFTPHRNETGYWWQGEDARLASLAAAARLTVPLISEDPDLQHRLEEYAANQLNWILGLNPFDACMLHGFGHNNPEYETRFPNAFGGICNGITAGLDNEEDVDFLPQPYAEQGEHRWRWSEQWIPHAAWFLLAVCAG